jgi:hypothetical protein
MLFPLPIVFAWFANPLILWGLGAASVPIVIHLLNKRKFREIRWAASRFLLAAIRKNQRRIRLEQWLLLALRTLLVILVVMAMARPFLESLGAVPLLQGGRTHWLVVLDGSMSMAAATGETTRFDQAKSLADGLVKSARQGDAFSVVVMGDPPRVVIGSPAFNNDAVRKEIDEIPLPHGGTNLRATFDKVNEVLSASSIPRKELIVITDLQKASWSPEGSETADAALKSAIVKLNTKKARSFVIDLGTPGLENRAITGVSLTPAILTPNVPAIIRATIKNFGRKPAENLRVRLLVDGQIGPDQTITLEPGAEEAVALTHEFIAPGDHALEVQIDDDVLKLDNHRWIAAPVREAIKVLLVDGDPKNETFKSDTDFLAAALSPEPEPNGPPAPIRTEIVAESNLSSRDLAPYDAVVLANVPRFTAPEVSALETYLKSGGGVILFSGDQVVPENYNQLLFNGGKGILPAALGPAVGDPKRQDRPFEFDPLGFKHPIVADFAGESATITASLTNVKTTRFSKLILPKNSTAQIALGFNNGDPAVIAMPKFRGKVIQVATTADADWTSWPLHQSYPPVMEQLVMQSAAGRVAERNLLVGQPLQQSFPASAIGAAATVRRPSGPSAALKLAADGESALLKYDNTDLSGSYRVSVGSPVGTESNFAVNVLPAESDPTRLDLVALKAAVPGWDFVYDNNWRPLRDNAASVGHRGELHRPLLWAVLALLLTESLLAWRFGHHAGTS